MSRAALAGLWLVAGAALAEGVAEREQHASTGQRIRGAVTLRPAAFGFVSLGGSTLKAFTPKTQQWTTLHQVPGDSVYRTASDERGRVLATWEKDPSVHLFDVPGKTHLAVPKPPCPVAGLQLCSVQELFFEAGGQSALVYLRGFKSGRADVTWAYRLWLDGTAPTALVFTQEGFGLLHTERGAVFGVPNQPGKRCGWRDCWPMGGVVAQELVGSGAVARTLYAAQGQELSSVTPVPGSDGTDVALLLTLRPNAHAVLRWRFGDERARRGVLPALLPLDPKLLLFRGEVAELRTGKDRSLELRRHGVDGTTEPLIVPALPPKDVDDRPDSAVHDVGVRANGGLWVHWGDFLVLLEPNQPPRRFDLEPLLGRRTEWAGVDVYQAKPEALWVGIEVGGGRDFALQPFAEVEKKAKPWGR